MGLLDGDIREIVGNAFGGFFLNATYRRDADVQNPDTGTVTRTTLDYACKAIMEMTPTRLRAGEAWVEGDRRFLVLAASLSIVPKPGDRVVFNGETWAVVSIDTDPATATWSIQGRR